MPSYNKVILIGNLTRDPDLKYTPSGTPVCNFGIAVNEKYKTQNGDAKEEVYFGEVVVWGRMGEACRDYIAKGYPVLIDGKLTTESWTDNAGEKKSKTRIKANIVQFLKMKEKAQIQELPKNETIKAPIKNSIEKTENDDIPF